MQAQLDGYEEKVNDLKDQIKNRPTEVVKEIHHHHVEKACSLM